jgi:hypothetical protein
MTLRAIFGRRWVHCLGLVGAATAGYVFGLTADRATAQAPAPLANRNIVALIYGSVPVTREELGEFLIARGGYEKVDLLVNKKIIEVEAHQRNITVTETEVRAGLEEDLRGLGIDLKDFTKHVLPRYGKSLYEWTEDVIKPRLLLTKMCRDRVRVTEDDLKRTFENRYGEKRQAKLICWGPGNEKTAQKQWAEARKGDAEFDSIARTQGDPNLAAACGLTAPVGRNAFEDTEGRDATVEKVLFSLKEGEISQLFQVSAGIMCVKCVKIIPPDATADFNKVRAALEKEVFEKKLNLEIPKFFGDLKKRADPHVYLKGPPTPKEFREGTNQILQTGGITPMTPKP